MSSGLESASSGIAEKDVIRFSHSLSYFLADTLHLSAQSGRLVLPDRSIIDDVFEYTPDRYRKHQTPTGDQKPKDLPSKMVVYWLKEKETHNAGSKDTGSGTLEVEIGGSESDKAP